MEETEAILDGLRKGLHTLRPVSGVVVDDEENHPRHAMEKPFDERDELGSAHLPLDGHESEFTLGGNGGNDVQPKTAPRAAYDGCLSPGSPGGPRMMVRTYPCFISEEDDGLHLPGKFFDAGILLIEPPFHRIRLLLIGTPDGTLRGKPRTLESAKSVGFKKLIFTDGFNSSWTYDLKRENYDCESAKADFRACEKLGGDSYINCLARINAPEGCGEVSIQHLLDKARQPQ
jgi:hypothetical protein